ncbi:hypothetical protein B484DRAFT_392558, partial [Ochromonadaceae sp. CCMP2298]
THAQVLAQVQGQVGGGPSQAEVARALLLVLQGEGLDVLGTDRRMAGCMLRPVLAGVKEVLKEEVKAIGAQDVHSGVAMEAGGAGTKTGVGAGAGGRLSLLHLSLSLCPPALYPALHTDGSTPPSAAVMVGRESAGAGRATAEAFDGAVRAARRPAQVQAQAQTAKEAHSKRSYEHALHRCLSRPGGNAGADADLLGEDVWSLRALRECVERAVGLLRLPLAPSICVVDRSERDAALHRAVLVGAVLGGLLGDVQQTQTQGEGREGSKSGRE